MQNLTRTLTVFAVILAGFAPVSSWAAEDPNSGYHLKYSVSEQTITVVAAVTPYDSNPQAKEAFLHWFKRGFETVLTGKPPLMIEWDVTPEARAGRRGYDFGMDEAERFLKNEKEPNQSLQTTPIPPA
jgi:hypothetical protein